MARPRSAGFDDHRRGILEVAAALFASKGYLGTSVNEVAEACGITKPTLYHYFRDKEDLLLQIADEHVTALRIGISNGLVCEKPGKPDSALGGQPMPAWMAWNWRLGRCLVWIRPALTARLALVGP